MHKVKAGAISTTLMLVFLLELHSAGKPNSGVCFADESEWGSMQLCDLGAFVRLSLSRQQYSIPGTYWTPDGRHAAKHQRAVTHVQDMSWDQHLIGQSMQAMMSTCSLYSFLKQNHSLYSVSTGGTAD